MPWPMSDLVHLARYARAVGLLSFAFALIYQYIAGPILTAGPSRYPLPRSSANDTADLVLHVVLGSLLSGFAGFLVAFLVLVLVWTWCVLR